MEQRLPASSNHLTQAFSNNNQELQRQTRREQIISNLHDHNHRCFNEHDNHSSASAGVQAHLQEQVFAGDESYFYANSATEPNLSTQHHQYQHPHTHRVSPSLIGVQPHHSSTDEGATQRILSASLTSDQSSNQEHNQHHQQQQWCALTKSTENHLNIPRDYTALGSHHSTTNSSCILNQPMANQYYSDNLGTKAATNLDVTSAFANRYFYSSSDQLTGSSSSTSASISTDQYQHQHHHHADYANYSQFYQHQRNAWQLSFNSNDHHCQQQYAPYNYFIDNQQHHQPQQQQQENIQDRIPFYYSNNQHVNPQHQSLYHCDQYASSHHYEARGFQFQDVGDSQIDQQSYQNVTQFSQNHYAPSSARNNSNAITTALHEESVDTLATWAQRHFTDSSSAGLRQDQSSSKVVGAVVPSESDVKINAQATKAQHDNLALNDEGSNNRLSDNQQSVVNNWRLPEPVKTQHIEFKSYQMSALIASDKKEVSGTGNRATAEPTVAIQRTNQCSICGRNYARPSTLKTHLRTHTNERPFKCNVCHKTFSQAANLTAHQRVHTGNFLSRIEWQSSTTTFNEILMWLFIKNILIPQVNVHFLVRSVNVSSVKVRPS